MSQHYSNFVSFPSRATRIHYNGFWIPPKNPELGYSLKDYVCGNLLELNDVDGVNFSLSSFVKLVRDKLKGALAEFLEYDIVWITNGVPSVLKTETEFIVMWSNAKVDESGHINLILQLQDSFDFDLCNGGSMVFDSKTDDSGVQEVKQKFKTTIKKVVNKPLLKKAPIRRSPRLLEKRKKMFPSLFGNVRLGRKLFCSGDPPVVQNIYDDEPEVQNLVEGDEGDDDISFWSEAVTQTTIFEQERGTEYLSTQASVVGQSSTQASNVEELSTQKQKGKAPLCVSSSDEGDEGVVGQSSMGASVVEELSIQKQKGKAPLCVSSSDEGDEGIEGLEDFEEPEIPFDPAPGQAYAEINGGAAHGVVPDPTYRPPPVVNDDDQGLVSDDDEGPEFNVDEFAPEITDFVGMGNVGDMPSVELDHEPTEFADFVESTRNVYPEDEDEPKRSLKLEIGMEFSSGKEFRMHLKTYAIVSKFCYEPVKAESNRYTARCKRQDQKCPWKIHASQVKDQATFKIRTLVNIHQCESQCQLKNPLADAKWVANVMEEKIRLHEKTYVPKEIVRSIWATYQVNISYHVGWAARCIVLEKINGSYAKSYEQVPSVCVEILKSNPRSVATFSRNHHDLSFGHMCICYRASIEGFINGCRPLIGLDGCFLKGKYGGVLLAAIGVDATSGLFPLAIYICRSEDTYNWKKFLMVIAGHLVQHRLNLTFISDRQKGLITAVHEVFPHANHRFCFRHMFKNFKGQFKGQLLESTVWAAAKAFKKSAFKYKMDEIQKLDPKAHDWLLKEDLNSWARSHFDLSSKCDYNCNNFSESFNSWILELREKPITFIALKYHSMMMTQFYKRRQTASLWPEDGLVPEVQEELNLLRNSTNNWVVRGAEQNTWEVEGSSGAKFIVNVQQRSCSCIRWQMRGFPCAHAVAVLAPSRPNWVDYFSEYYTVRAYRSTYAGAVLPLDDMEDWQEPFTLVKEPKVEHRQPGRPKMARRRGPEEAAASKAKKQKKCHSCGSIGHNARTCRGPGQRPVRSSKGPFQFTGEYTGQSSGQVRGRGSRGGNTSQARGRGSMRSGARGGSSSTSGVGRGLNRDFSSSGAADGSTSRGRGRGRGSRGRGRGGRGGGRGGRATVSQTISQNLKDGGFSQTFHQFFDLGDLQRASTSQQQQPGPSTSQQQQQQQPNTTWSQPQTFSNSRVFSKGGLFM